MRMKFRDDDDDSMTIWQYDNKYEIEVKRKKHSDYIT